jgi:hypothetical protein
MVEGGNLFSPEEKSAEWLATAAGFLGEMRDFERVHALLDEALALLREAETHLECGSMVAQWALLHHQRSEWSELEQTLTEFERLSPLAEKSFQDWVRELRTTVAYHQGDIETAIALGEAGRVCKTRR